MFKAEFRKITYVLCKLLDIDDMELAEVSVEAEKLKQEDNHFYFTLLGKLNKDLDNHNSKQNFQKSVKVSQNKNG